MPNSPLDNKLLAALPRRDFDALVNHLTSVSLLQGTVIYEPGDEIDHVYLPNNGVFSLRVVMKDGSAIETATVGKEGVVGAMAGLGLYKSPVRAVVQSLTSTSKIAAPQFRKLVSGSDALRNLCIHFNEVLLTQARIAVACNALHQLEPRLCRLLLQSADRAGNNSVTLTQELIAEMLGVRRTSVTDVASRLQKKGLITYWRGVIEILDRRAVEVGSCECYQTLVDRGLDQRRKGLP